MKRKSFPDSVATEKENSIIRHQGQQGGKGCKALIVRDVYDQKEHSYQNKERDAETQQQCMVGHIAGSPDRHFITNP